MSYEFGFVEVKKPIAFVVVLALVVASAGYIEYTKPSTKTTNSEINLVDTDAVSSNETLTEKRMEFRKAKPIVNPSGFVNTDNVSIRNLIGDKVVLVDFWTYSCVNCQRTFPYLNAWYDKYEEYGLEIVGVHSPEFNFEKKRSNVVGAVERYGIEYPVVLDNSFSTWSAYDNRYWPQKYLIGIDGFIRYEHIGEGSYAETERMIQKLLKERARELGKKIDIPDGIVDPDAENVSFSKITTPEIYFGAGRNELGNGRSGVTGTQNLSLPDTLDSDEVYLSGTWKFSREYATNRGEATVALRYEAKDVNMVLDSTSGVTNLTVTIDGDPLGDLAGRDVMNIDGRSVVRVRDERLYNIVSGDEYASHELRIHVNETGLKAYTFTFG